MQIFVFLVWAALNEEAVDYMRKNSYYIENGVARIVGEDSKSFNKFIRWRRSGIENGIVDLTSMSGWCGIKL